MRLFILLVLVLLLTACGKRFVHPPNGIVEPEMSWFTTTNAKSEKLFDVRAPNGRWQWRDRTLWESGIKSFRFDYKGSNSGMINAEIRIEFLESWSSRILQAQKKLTSVADIERRLKLSITKPNFISTFKPKNLVADIRSLAGLQCGYLSYDNHAGPKLDSVVKEFRGMGSFRKEHWYRCPVMRDGKLWFFMVAIVYQYSDLIAKNNLNISLDQTIKDFDSMLAPTLKSLKLYGDLKQY